METLSVVWAPVRVLRAAAAGNRVFAGFVVTAAYAVLGLAATVAAILGGVTRAQFEGQQVPPGLPSWTLDNIRVATEVGLVASAVLTPFVAWIGFSLTMQLVTRFFNGAGPLPAMFAVVGISGVPLVLSSGAGLVLTGLQAAVGAGSAVGVTLGYAGGLLGIAASVWYVILVVIGASQARGLDYAESAGSCAVSCVGCAGLIILVVIVVGLGAALLFAPAISPQG